MPKKYQGADGDEEGCQTGVEIVAHGGGFGSVVFEVVVWWWLFLVRMDLSGGRLGYWPAKKLFIDSFTHFLCLSFSHSSDFPLIH